MTWKDELKLRETCKECGWDIVNWGVKKNHKKKEYDWFSLSPDYFDTRENIPVDIEKLYSIFLEKMGNRADKCELFFVRNRYAREQRYPAISISVG